MIARIGVENVDFHVGKAEDVLPAVLAAIPPEHNVVGIVDPPRAGLRLDVPRRLHQVT